MRLKQVFELLLAGNSLDPEQMTQLLQEIFSGAVSEIQAAAILSLLATKGESVDEIAAAAKVMRSLSQKVNVHEKMAVIDTCGTGGDGLCTFNISTASSFVVAAAGVPVAKHGGRSVSSSSGSVDVLEMMGIPVSRWDLSQIEAFLKRFNWTFMFAPNHHSAMKRTATVRKELGFRTLFNILGPLTNPACAEYQLLGVYSPHLTGVMAQVLAQLGSRKALVVHGHEGLDEISLSGPTTVAELNQGDISHYVITPEHFGLKPAPINAFLVKNATESMFYIDQVLNFQPGPATDIVLLNAGAALYVADRVSSIGEGIHLAAEVLKSGRAKKLRDDMVEVANG